MNKFQNIMFGSRRFFVRGFFSEPECYGDFVYKVQTLIGNFKNGFSHQLRKIIIFQKHVEYTLKLKCDVAVRMLNLSVNHG